MDEDVQFALQYVAKIAQMAQDVAVDSEAAQYVQSMETNKTLNHCIELLKTSCLLKEDSYEEKLASIVRKLLLSIMKSDRKELMRACREIKSCKELVAALTMYELDFVHREAYPKDYPKKEPEKSTCKNPEITTCNSYPCQC